MEQVTLQIHYLNDTITRLEYIDGKSDWIDLRAAERVENCGSVQCFYGLGVTRQNHGCNIRRCHYGNHNTGSSSGLGDIEPPCRASRSECIKGGRVSGE